MTKYTIKTPITFIFKKDKYHNFAWIRNFEKGDVIGIKNKKIYFIPRDAQFGKRGKYTSFLVAKDFIEKNTFRSGYQHFIDLTKQNVTGDTVVLSLIYELIDANAISEDTSEYDVLQIEKKEKELAELKAKLNMGE